MCQLTFLQKVIVDTFNVHNLLSRVNDVYANLIFDTKITASTCCLVLILQLINHASGQKA